jgi:hypothetical protein
MQAAAAAADLCTVPCYSNTSSTIVRSLPVQCVAAAAALLLTCVEDADVIDPAVRCPPEVERVPALLPVHASIVAPHHPTQTADALHYITLQMMIHPCSTAAEYYAVFKRP